MLLEINSTNGSMAMIIVMLVLAVIMYALHFVFIIKYIVYAFKDKNILAEKNVAIAGYFSILTMVVLFLIAAFGFSNTYITLERNYTGCYLGIAAIAIIPELIIADIKQVKWIKNLSDASQKEYGISIKDRRPLVFVIIGLIFINLLIFGVILESFFYILQGLL